MFGIKPTFGRLSRRGAFPFVQSLDHAGAFAGSAADLALAYDALQGPDPEDPQQSDRPVEPASPRLDEPPGALRVGVLGGWFQADASPEVLSALSDVVKALSAAPAELRAPAPPAPPPSACPPRRAGRCTSPTCGRGRGDFDPATRDRLIAGAMQPAATLAGAQRVRRRFLAEALALFERFDVLVAPAVPFTATPIGQATVLIGGAPVSVRASLGLYTQPISCIGLPVVAAPVVRAGAMRAACS